MRAQKTITQLYHEHEKAFAKNLEAAKSLKEKQVHKLRVEIKNLRVLFDFLKTLSSKKLHTGTVLHLLSPVFKTAGKIRTSHLNQNLTKAQRSGIIARFREHLKKREKKAGKKLVEHIHDFDLKKFDNLHKRNLKAVKGVNTSSVLKKSSLYLKSSMGRIRSEAASIKSDKVMHNIRKELKTLKNMGRLVDEIKPDKKLEKELARINDTYEHIGKWHDAVVLVDELEKYVSKHEGGKNRKKAASLINKLKNQNEKQRNNLGKKLQKEFNGIQSVH